MQKNDIICRAAIYPKFVNLDIFDEEFLFSFQSDARKIIYVNSVASKYLLRSNAAVHEYGESAAEAGNRRLAEKFGNQIPPEKRSIYLGFYNIFFGDVVSIQMSYYSICVKWRPELDCDAHYQIEMWPTSTVGNRGERNRDRIAAIHQIFQTCFGPVYSNMPTGSESRNLQKLLPNKPPQPHQTQ